MSVKFAKEVITEAAIPGGTQPFGLDIGKSLSGGGKQPFGLDIGKSLSGGGGSLQQGYLAVRKHRTKIWELFGIELTRSRRLTSINFRKIPFVLKC